MQSQNGKIQLKDDIYLKFIFATEEGPQAFRLSYSAKKSWRLQSSLAGKAGQVAQFPELGAAGILARDLAEDWSDECVRLEVKQTKAVCQIKAADGARAVLAWQPFRLSFLDGQGQEKTALTGLEKADQTLTVWGDLAADEYIYGTGQRFNQVNQRGKQCTMMAIDQWCEREGNSYVPIPLLLSSKGYALFLDRFESAIFDLGQQKENSWSISLTAAPLDLRVFLADDPKVILRSYAELTGFAPMPAEWLLGIFVSRHGRLQELVSYENVMQVVRKMAEHDLPWDGMTLEGWPTYDTASYPELKKTVEALHDLGKKVLVYQACGRIDHSSNAEARELTKKKLGAKDDYLVRSKADAITLLPETASYNPLDNPYNRFSEYIDLTNPQALEWFFGDVWQKLTGVIGVDGAKIDFCEQFPEHIELAFHDGRPTSGAHHWYPTLFNSLMYRHFNELRPAGGMCFSRGGGIGAQRYPFMWAGDQRREWVFLEAILVSMLSSGLSGIPFMSHDLAGYIPAHDLEENPEPDIFIRGAQLASFSLNMQTHGTVTRPYDFAPEIVNIYRSYCEIHQLLRPYLAQQSRIATKTGLPVLRHLFLYDHEDPATYAVEDQYLLGDDLLIAPVLTAGTKRDIYLPRGEWQDLLTDTVYPGRQTLTDFPAPLCKIPVFYNLAKSSICLAELLPSLKEILRKL